MGEVESATMPTKRVTGKTKVKGDSLRPREEISRENFQRNLVKFRKERGISRDEAAHRIGVTARYLQMLEKGERAIPRLEVLKRIGEAYGRRVDDLDDPDPPPADPRLYPSLRWEILLTDAEVHLIPGEVVKAYEEFEAIERRLVKKLQEAKEKLLSSKK